MYPFRAIIIGGSEAERTTIRREVTNLSVAIDCEFDDIDKAISQRTLLTDTKCFFLVKVNSSANMDQMSRLNQLFMGKPIVALLNEDSDVSAVLHIQRAGAAQVLLLPFQPGQLRAALDTVAWQFGCPTTSSKVIAVLGASEGCGATTLAINLSDAIANKHNKSCILVELSLRLGRLGSYLNIEPTVTVSDLLAGDSALEVNAVNHALIRVTDRFQVVAGPQRSVDRRPIVPARVLPLIGSMRQMADVVVLDMPYTFDDLYFEALSVADQIVLVARSSPPSIQALMVVAEAVGQMAPAVTQHLVINGYGPDEDFTAAELGMALAVERIWTIANDPEGFEAAVKNGRPLHQEAPRSRAWPGITALANHIIIGPKKPLAPKRAASWSTWLAGLFRSSPPAANTAVATQ